MPDGRLLAIYLNDHLAGATIGLELTKRSLRSNRGTPLGTFLAGFLAEVTEDRASLENVMDRLGVKKSLAKRSAAVVAERLGRLKLNGQVRGYSPLSRVLELEGLSIGVEGKLGLWQNLRDTAEVVAALREVDLDALIARAERQRASLERERLAAARRAFAGPAA
jgi:hypothetical protein